MLAVFCVAPAVVSEVLAVDGSKKFDHVLRRGCGIGWIFRQENDKPEAEDDVEMWLEEVYAGNIVELDVDDACGGR